MKSEKDRDKLFYRLEEVSRISELDPKVIEGWEKDFPFLHAGQTGSGHKIFRQKDLDIILRLKELLIKEGLTLAGAKRKIQSEFEGRADDYTDHVCRKMLPALREWWRGRREIGPLPFVDVFCEKGAFSLEQSRRILEAAKSLGFPLKVHADEFGGLGGTALAVSLGATSADHLVHTRPEDIEALGRSATVAVALPCTPFGLAESGYTPAQALLEAGAILAIATDLNPGTAWCESMQFAIALACRAMRLTPAQAIAASTINAAAAISRQDRVGSLEPGKQADLLLLDAPDYRHLGYRFGTNLVAAVMKSGRWVSGR